MKSNSSFLGYVAELMDQRGTVEDLMDSNSRFAIAAVSKLGDGKEPQRGRRNDIK